mmetsp:Transcript_23649/g.50179  ORF Transcript_23649/g.50179 Transcript_23649/m.50179 type:complete len:114 (-) Transcript_23649:387-728(-)
MYRQFDEADRIAMLAKSMLDYIVASKLVVARVYSSVYGIIGLWRTAYIHSLIDPLTSASAIGFDLKHSENYFSHRGDLLHWLRFAGRIGDIYSTCFGGLACFILSRKRNLNLI